MDRTRRPHALVLIAFAAVTACGCNRLIPSTRLEKQSGVVYVLSGIEGISPATRSIARGLQDSNVKCAVEFFEWTTRTGVLGWYVHLAATERNQRQAQRLADQVIQYQTAYPEGRVFLVAHSGGAAIVLSAAEQLPEGKQVDGIVLLGAAVSPSYDLRRALRASRQGIWNFHSPYDLILLTAGTTVFGTSDRKHEVAAGASGFRTPIILDRDDRQLYADKLHQVEYRREMRQTGHWGTHFGWASHSFIMHWLAPIVRGRPAARAAEVQPPRESRADYIP